LLSPKGLERRLRRDVVRFLHKPLRFCRYAFPWGEGELAGSPGPRHWQAEILRTIGKHLRNPVTRHQPCLVAVASGHGIGKSSLVGMLINWAMSTCEDCKIVVIANTFTQLQTKTIPEVSKWCRLSINSHWWQLKATSIAVRDRNHERTWRTDFIPWSENNTEAFAGLHNRGKRIVLIADEASAISDKIWEVAEGALTDEATEIIWLALGNPTQNTGRFRECFGRFKHRWKRFQIDARQVEGTNKTQLEKWVEDYGEDSDFVRVRVRGEFPRAATNQFIGSDLVAVCRKYRAQGCATLPKILSVDVARFGDDQTVIGTRQGRKVRILARLRGLDTVHVAERVIRLMEQECPDATVIDGDGIGAGVIDQLRFRGFEDQLFEFHGSQSAHDAKMYFNRRSEIWGLMRDAMKEGLEIPDDPELESDLTGPHYGFSSKQQIQLEKKEDMKRRGLSSPDCGDMVAMTFAEKIATPISEPEEHRYIYDFPGNPNAWMEG
jgi:hypothetical protein